MCRLPGRRARVGACIIALLFPSLLASPASAAAGALDPTFGGDGVVTTDVGPGTDVGVAVAIQADGKAVMVGVAGVDRRNSRFGVTRYDDDGTLDATFGGGDGKVVTDLTRGYDEADAVAIQDDGKIVVAGLAGERLALARYGTGGGLDPSFGGDGRVTTDLSRARDFAYAVGIQDDGKIVAAGYVGGAGGRFAVVRYESDGSLDGTFGGGDGWAAVDFSPGYDYADDLAIQADGKIILAGAANYFGTRGRVALARFDTTGSLDPGFGGGDGKVASDLGPGFDAVYAVAIQPTDEKILAAGQAGERLAVLRYDTSGVPDPTFGGDGVARVDFTRGLDYADEVVI